MARLRGAGILLGILLIGGGLGVGASLAQTVEQPVFWTGGDRQSSLFTQSGAAALANPLPNPQGLRISSAVPLNTENAFYALEFNGPLNTPSRVTKMGANGPASWTIQTPTYPYLATGVRVDPETDRLGFVTYGYNPDVSTIVLVDKTGTISTLPLLFQSTSFEFAPGGGFYVSNPGPGGFPQVLLLDSLGNLVRRFESVGPIRLVVSEGDGLYIVRALDDRIIRMTHDLTTEVWHQDGSDGVHQILGAGGLLWVLTQSRSGPDFSIDVRDPVDGALLDRLALGPSENGAYRLAAMNDDSVWVVWNRGALTHLAYRHGPGLEVIGTVPVARDATWIAPLQGDVTYPDPDGDGLGTPFDNCPANPNPGQEDANGDKAGDACQPKATIRTILQDGGDTLEVDAMVSDPVGDALSGTIAIDCLTDDATGTLPAVDLGHACAAQGYFPEGIAGEGFIYVPGTQNDGAYLWDYSRWIRGVCGGNAAAVYWSALGTCAHPDSPFAIGLALGQHTIPPGLPYKVCTKKIADPSKAFELWITAQDAQLMSFRIGVDAGHFATTYAGSLPTSLPLTGLPGGGSPTNCSLTLTTTDGDTPTVFAVRDFQYQGEGTLVFRALDPQTLLESLAAQVEGLGTGVDNAIQSKLDAAVHALAWGNTKAAVNQIEAAIRLIEAQRGRKIDEALADQLIAEARYILTLLGEPAAGARTSSGSRGPRSPRLWQVPPSSTAPPPSRGPTSGPRPQAP